DGLQVIGFPPPCHPSYEALAFTSAGLSPAERVSIHWTHKWFFNLLRSIYSIAISGRARLTPGEWIRRASDYFRLGLRSEMSLRMRVGFHFYSVLPLCGKSRQIASCGSDRLARHTGANDQR